MIACDVRCTENSESIGMLRDVLQYERRTMASGRGLANAEKATLALRLVRRGVCTNDRRPT